MPTLGSTRTRARNSAPLPRNRGGGAKGVAVARKQGINTSTPAGAALIDPDKDLTDKQRLFVKLWAQGESPLSASIKAGYADGGSFAYRMVHMPNILKLYNEEKLAFEAASQMTRKRVIDGFLEGIEMAKMLAEPSSVIAGWREIAKVCGYMAPVEIKQTITHEGKVMVERMEKLTDDELFRLINAQAEALSNGTSAGDTHGNTPVLPEGSS